jgi:hypothetical protein
MSDLDAFCFRMQKKKNRTLADYVSELTETARKHGISLSPEDFVLKSGELGDLELEGVAGGAGGNCVSQLWLDLYSMQPGRYEGTDEAAKDK